MKKNYLLLLILCLPFYNYSQKLESISPSTGIAGRQGIDIVIKTSGTHFTQGGDLTVDYSFSPGMYLHNINLVNDTVLITNISIPANTPTGDYVITVNDSIDGTLTTNFHVTARPLPIIVSMNPSTANAGDTFDVTVKGTGTRFKQDSTLVLLRILPGEATTNSVNVLNDTVLVANITLPATAYTDTYDVFFYTMDDGTFQFNTFKVNGVTPPTIKSITPPGGNAGETITMSVIGDHTHFETNKMKVYVDYKDGKDWVYADTVNVISDTALTAVMPIPATALTGNYTVYAVQYDGNNSLGMGTYDHFHVNALPPSLDSITYNVIHIYSGTTVTLTLHGKNTHFVPNQTTVHFAFDSMGTAVNSVKVLTDTTLEVNVTVPLNTIRRDYSVSVTNPIDGTFEKVNCLHIEAPILIHPNEAYTSQTLDVTITGVYSPATVAEITLKFLASDTTMPSKIIVNSISIIDSATLRANITIPANQPEGYYNMYLAIMDGGGLYYNYFHVKSVNCLSYFTTSYDMANNTFTLRLDSLASNALSYRWDFGDGGKSTVQLPSHTFANDTLYNVCLTTKRSTTDSCTFCHVIGKDSHGNPVLKNKKGFFANVIPYKTVITAIDDVSPSDARVVLYPNPIDNSEVLTIEMDNLTAAKVRVSITDVLGKRIIDENVSVVDRVFKKQFSFENNLLKGIYFVSVATEATVMTKKLVVQ